MADAALVVIVLGRSKGVLWELSEAIRTVPLERVVLVVPYSRRQYDMYRVELPGLLREVLTGGEAQVGRVTEDFPQFPKFGGREQALSRVQGLVRFSGDGTASFVPLQHYAGWYNSLDEMVDRAMRRDLPLQNLYEGRRSDPVPVLDRLAAGALVVASLPLMAKIGTFSSGSVLSLLELVGRSLVPVLFLALASGLWMGFVGRRIPVLTLAALVGLSMFTTWGLSPDSISFLAVVAAGLTLGLASRRSAGRW